MEKKQTAVRKITRLCQIALGNTVYAAAVILFIVPDGLITRGTMGLALFVPHIVGIPVGLFVSIFSVIIFLLGAWILGRQFALTTVSSMAIHPLMPGLLGGLGFGGFVMQGKLAAVIYAGILIGASIGIVMRAGASTGGANIPFLVLRKKFEINVSFNLYLADCIILGLQLIFADSHTILYGILLAIIYTTVLNEVLVSGNVGIQVKIMSRKYEAINRLTAERLDCGTSLFHMETEYLHRKREVVLAIIARCDLSRLSQLVMNEDPEVFVIINQINKVRGWGFTLKRVHQDSTCQE